VLIFLPVDVPEMRPCIRIPGIELNGLFQAFSCRQMGLSSVNGQLGVAAKYTAVSFQAVCGLGDQLMLSDSRQNTT